jgi:hypothetical protein
VTVSMVACSLLESTTAVSPTRAVLMGSGGKHAVRSVVVVDGQIGGERAERATQNCLPGSRVRRMPRRAPRVSESARPPQTARHRQRPGVSGDRVAAGASARSPRALPSR